MASTRRPVAVDLFCGVGGFSLGFEQAGFDVVAAVEVDPVHCAAHAFNFPNTAILPHPVEAVGAKNIRHAANLGNREIDCVIGGAPCQGFSLIGQRILDDPRNKLVREFLRLVVELKARAFVFENVKGLTLGRHKKLLDELIAEFKAAGYDVRVPWQVLNAGRYGTPQCRERLFLIGAKKGEPLPDYPSPTTNIRGRPKPPQLFESLADGPSCADALADLPDAEKFRALENSDTVQTELGDEPPSYAAQLRCMTDDAWHFGYAREWDSSLLTSSARTHHTDISRRRFAETPPGAVEPISRFFRLPEDGVANTLRAGTDGARGAFTSPRPIHYLYNRCVTVREMARLHGFPDWFRFNATKWHGARQIGNSVPPPLGREVAKCVIRALGASPVRPQGRVQLGDPKLLELDLSAAARYFGVKALESRRDRKSDVRKRRQIDIERERLGGMAHV